MDQENKSLRVGAAVILCAVVIRLISSGFFDPVVQFIQQPQAAAFLLYLETGRVTRYREPSAAPKDWAAESPAPDLPVPTVPQTRAAFSAQDMDLVEVRYSGSYDPDLESLLLQPLDMDLTGAEPTVLILHTHTTESYTKTADQNYEESSAYRTLDEDYNLLRVGDLLAEQLENAGITVLHDRTLHDYPSYNGSYNHSRASAQKYLEEYPSIQLVLDIHRDAGETADGEQLSTAVTINGTDTAQLMLVMGTGENGLSHPHWQENLALALKLQAQLEKIAPGICRPLILRGQRYNQDLHPHMLLVEVGAAGDTQPEAFHAVASLAQAIIALSKGTA